MSTRFLHVNIISGNWRKLADFYIKVFGCRLKYEEREYSGKWLDELTGIDDARLHGTELLLPGSEPNGPAIEIFEYNKDLINNNRQINLHGMAHLAFAVDDVEGTLKLILENGGSKLGKFINTDIPGVGRIKIIFTRDPEGNIVEIQRVE